MCGVGVIFVQCPFILWNELTNSLIHWIYLARPGTSHSVKLKPIRFVTHIIVINWNISNLKVKQPIDVKLGTKVLGNITHIIMSPMFWIGYHGNNESTNHVTFNRNSNLKQIFEISTKQSCISIYATSAPNFKLIRHSCLEFCSIT